MTIVVTKCASMRKPMLWRVAGRNDNNNVEIALILPNLRTLSAADTGRHLSGKGLQMSSRRADCQSTYFWKNIRPSHIFLRCRRTRA